MSTQGDAGAHEPKPKCGAMRAGRGPCGLPAGWGTNHVGTGPCRKHLGSTPNHVKAAGRVKAERAVAQFAARVDIEPTEAMLEVLGIRYGMVRFLTAKVASFDSDDELKQLDLTMRFEKPAVWVEMLETALRELGRAAKACVDVGIEERRVRIQEDIGRQLGDVLRAVLDGVFSGLVRAGASADVVVAFQRDELPGIVRGALAAVVFRSEPAELGPDESA